jgi:hypothetical protein
MCPQLTLRTERFITHITEKTNAPHHEDDVNSDYPGKVRGKI